MSASNYKLAVILFFTIICTICAGDVHPIEVDDKGGCRFPLRYWSHRQPFEDIRRSFVFLAEVTSVGEKPPPQTYRSGHMEPPRFRSGTLTVIERLWPHEGGPPGLDKVKSLNVEGTEGLQVGDRVIVLVDTEFYEGFYVINYHEGGCILGIRLPPKDDLAFGRKEQDALIDLIRKNKAIEKLTPEELYLWLHVDSTGIGGALIQEIDRGRLKWGKKAK